MPAIQRIGVARTLPTQSEFLVCDAAVATLDVPTRPAVLNLFIDARSRLDLTSRFTGHDFGIVRHLSDRVLIMYPGRGAEAAPAEEVLAHLHHPCTQALPVEVPRIQARARKLTVIAAKIPSVRAPASGCDFHPRCRRHAMPCRKLEVPASQNIAPSHRGACCLNDA